MNLEAGGILCIFGSCGSCYAFTAVAAIESYYLIHFNKSLDLSEQFGFSCATRSGQCNGGSPSDVLNVSKTVSIPSEACDPYLQVNETCNPKKCEGKERYFIDSYKFYGKDENLIAKNLYLYGPATFCFWVPIEMVYYTGGILNAPGEECRNRSIGGHCMLLVGYTPEYWIAKNSAGVLSGENGFVKFKRFQNFCGFTAGIYGPTKNNSSVTFGTKVFSTTTPSPPVPTGCTTNDAMNDTARNYVLYHWNGRRSQIAKGQFQLRNGTFLPPGKNINKLVYNCSIEAMLKSYDSTGKPPNTSDWMFYAYVTKKKLTTTTSIACWPTTENGLLKTRWSMLCGISPIKNASAALYTIGPACKVNANCTKKGYYKCDAIMGLCYY
uniref:Peptidase C1A papain C-terminal domain-containing protein n=1 Tax=Panagrolaimus davidi TaxID=227884 RepID=A0A914PZT7_9BILA